MEENQSNFTRSTNRVAPRVNTIPGFQILTIVLLLINTCALGYVIYQQSHLESKLTPTVATENTKKMPETSADTVAQETTDSKSIVTYSSTPITSFSSVADDSSQKSHVVQSGESLTVIAAQYNMDVTKLKELNNLNSDVISTGQSLIVE